MQLRGQDGPLARPLAVCAGRGVFTGYASLFGRRDASGDVVMPGAFAETLRRKGADRIRMLFQHDPAEPVGTWVEIREDHRGLLRSRGRLDCNVQRGRELLSLLDSRGLDGLSIGFARSCASRDKASGARRLQQNRPVGDLAGDLSDARGRPRQRRRSAGDGCRLAELLSSRQGASTPATGRRT